MPIAVTTEWPAKAVVVETVGGGVTVITAGNQGPPGATGATGAVGSGSSLQYQAENKSGGTLAAGTVVTQHSSGTGVVAARADAILMRAVGLLPAAVASAIGGAVQTAGPMVLANWTAVTGTVSLVTRGLYFLDAATAGKLTLTPPMTSGQVVQFVGEAVAADTLEIRISRPILL